MSKSGVEKKFSQILLWETGGIGLFFVTQAW
jgi:hypothetical protein